MFLYAFFFVPMRAWAPCFLTLNFFFDVEFFFDIGVGCGLQSGRRHVDTRRHHGQRTPLHSRRGAHPANKEEIKISVWREGQIFGRGVEPLESRGAITCTCVSVKKEAL